MSNFTDNSPIAATPTITGSPVIDTTTKLYGAGSYSHSYALTTAYVSYPSNASYVLDGDFTVEFAAKFSSTVGANNAYILQIWSITDAWTDSIYCISNGVNLLSLACTFGNKSSITIDNSLDTTTWHQYAITRSGTDLYTFKDGTLVTHSAGASTTAGRNNGIIHVPSRTLYYSAPANIDDIRITKGVCRYTSVYTPRTRAFPNS